MHRGGSRSSSLRRCSSSARHEPIHEYDGLAPDERRWLADINLRRLSDPSSLSADEIARARGLGPSNVQVTVFRGDSVCGR